MAWTWEKRTTQRLQLAMEATVGIVGTIATAAYLPFVAIASLRGIEKVLVGDTGMEPERDRGLEVVVAVVIASTTAVLPWTTAVTTTITKAISAATTTTIESPGHEEDAGTRIAPVLGTIVAVVENLGEVIVIIAMDIRTAVAATMIVAMGKGATIEALYAIEASAGVRGGDD